MVQCCRRRPRPSTHQGGAVPVDLLTWDLVGLGCANWVQKYAPTVAESSEYGSATRARCVVLGSRCTGAGAEPGHGAGLWQAGLMRFDGPSLTALSAARHRAIHRVLDGGALFEDPVALALLGLEPSEVDPALRADQSSQRMRWFIAARSRFAEDRARAATRSGLSQVVVLGAGLDSFAYRLTSDPSVTVFEVDHPAPRRHGSGSGSMPHASRRRPRWCTCRSTSRLMTPSTLCQREGSTMRPRRCSFGSVWCPI